MIIYSSPYAKQAYSMDEYRKIDGNVISEGYARTYKFRYDGENVTDPNPTVIVLARYRHKGTGNRHLAGININEILDDYNKGEEFIEKANSIEDVDERNEMLFSGRQLIRKFNVLQQGLQDIISIPAEEKVVDPKSGKMTIKTRRSARNPKDRYKYGRDHSSDIMKYLIKRPKKEKREKIEHSRRKQN
jgi:hypothetical protein